MSIDWDIHRRAKFVKELRIPRRSTLVLFTLVIFKNGEEVWRIVAHASKGAIEALLKMAV